MLTAVPTGPGGAAGAGVLAGVTLSSLTLRAHPVAQQVAAASAAGFGGIGAHARDYAEGRADLDELAAAVARHPIEVRDVEALRPWSDTAEHRGLEMAAMALCERFGARYVQVCGPHGTTPERAAEAYGRLCDRFAPLGVRCGLEYLPFTDIPDPAAAAAIVRLAGRANGGICVDAWHTRRVGLAADDLVPFAGDVIALQLCDGPREPVREDLRDECLSCRVAPGEGELDLPPLVDLARSVPQPVHLSVEVLSDELDALGAAEAARRVAAGTARCLQAGTGSSII